MKIDNRLRCGHLEECEGCRGRLKGREGCRGLLEGQEGRPGRLAGREGYRGRLEGREGRRGHQGSEGHIALLMQWFRSRHSGPRRITRIQHF